MNSLLCLAFLFSNAPEQQLPIPWAGTSYSRLAENEPLDDLLRGFFADQGIIAKLSEGVTGQVSGQFKHWSPNQFFTHMIAANGLIWYYDGRVLYVYHGDEMDSRFISLENLQPESLKTYLGRVGLADPRYPLKSIDEQGLVYVTGPQRYVELVDQTAGALDANATRRAAREGMRTAIEVFHLKYAPAADLTFQSSSGDITVPGVVTVLKGLLGEDQQTVEADSGGPRALRPLEEDFEKPESMMPRSKGLPQLQAEPRTNTIIIRDHAENMSLYHHLIQQLDTSPGLVEIQVSIVDVSTDYRRELGIDWRREKTDEISAGFGADNVLVPGNHPYPGGAGLRITTIVGDMADYFLARINALEEDGNARMLSRPSLLTLDNVAAHLEHGSTFYVRVAGEREVDLFSVSAGVSLRVHPHIIEENGQQRIRLAVNVEDGQVSSATVDDIPRITRSRISTQAIVGQGESLLLGGYLQEHEEFGEQRVPVLGKIPLLKALFRNNRKAHGKVERLFMITPRIVNPMGGK